MAETARSRLRSLLVRGPFHGPSGYDRHVRAFVRELSRQGVAVQLADLPEWSAAALPPAARDPWFESLLRPLDTHTALHFTMPHQVVRYPGRVTVNYTMWESTRIPQFWAPYSQSHDLVIVPTESSRLAWLAGGVPESLLRICPLGVDADLFGPQASPLSLDQVTPLDGAGTAGDSLPPAGSYRVRFLHVSELNPRKNLAGLLSAWLQATARGDDAALILKIGFYVPGFREVFAQVVESAQEAAGRRLRDAAPIYLFDALLPDEEMPRLYAAATHYISMSLGEGWDQPMMEAAATGLRLIAPDHSAYTAYLDSTVARLIPAREVPADFPPGDWFAQFLSGSQWSQPDEKEAAAAVRQAIDHPDAGPSGARERIAREFTWERATRRLIEILSEEEARGARRRFRPWRRASRRD